MIAILSPAKSLNEKPLDRSIPHTEIRLKEDVEKLLVTTRRLTKPKLKSLMNISDKLAKLNRQRFQDMEMPFTEDNAKQAALLFSGDTYVGFDADSLDADELEYAQEHVRILSGLYGLVRPLDLIAPYRLEMGTRLPTRRGKTLYKFWGTRITDALNDELESHADRTIVNLASNEYFNALQPDKLAGDVLECSFRELRDGKLRFISFSAKRARGMMARFIVKNRIDHRESLRSFDYGAYAFDAERSTDNEYVFVRPDQRT